jgi:hypothetical protein
MDPESQPYRFKISLRLAHPSADLSNCSKEFGLEPLREWKRGDARTTPRGRPLEGLRDDSYWTTPLDVSNSKDLESALGQIANWLESHEPFLARHAESGGVTRLFIGFFLESFKTGFLLEPALLAKYSSLGVGLDFDMYGHDESYAP